MAYIYKIVTRPEWKEACFKGIFTGAKIDHIDGYIHFSTAEQVAQTANKHFKNQKDLLLVKVQAEKLGLALRYEISRGGALFPHLYADLPVKLAEDVIEFKPDQNGVFSFSERAE